MLSVGRFDVLERGDGLLRLAARHSDVSRVPRYLVALGVVFSVGSSVALAYAHPLYPTLAVMVFGLVLLVGLYQDMQRVAAIGVMTFVERSLDVRVERGSEYRGGARTTVVADRRSRTSTTAAVQVREAPLEANARGSVYRVYLLLDDEALIVDVTQSAMGASRLAEVLARALGVALAREARGEVPTGSGCLVSMGYFLALFAAWAGGMFALANAAVADHHRAASPLRYGALAAAMVVAMFIVQGAFVWPMRSAARKHVRAHFG